MAQQETPSDDVGVEQQPGASAAAENRETAQPASGAPEATWPGRRFARGPLSAGERDRMLSEARDIRFPIAMRGYNRAEVDRYVKEVRRLIAEVEISSSPESAVRHALDEVSEETRGILQRAHQTAEEITARSRAKADDRLQQAEQEARETREAAQREAEDTREAAASEAHQLREVAAREAQQLRETAQREVAALRDAATGEVTELKETTSRETRQLRAVTEREADELSGSTRREADEMLEAAASRARELTQNAEAIWRERRRLIEDVTAVGAQLLAIGEAEAKRFPRFAQDAAITAERGDDSEPSERRKADEQH